MVALPNYDEPTSVRLQIFLDNHNFGPGKIDGEMGEFFRKALLAGKKPTQATVNHGFLRTTDAWQDRFFKKQPSTVLDYFLEETDTSGS